MSQGPIRVAVTQVHRWVGLTAGLLAVFLAVTGGWIVLRPVLDPVTYPRLLVIPACTHPLPVDAVAAAARRFHPKGRLDYVWLYGSPTASTMVRFSNQDQVYVDGCSGKVLGLQPRYGGLYGTVEWLHRFKFMDAKSAMLIIGYTSLLMAILLVAGGVFLWWPRRASVWKSALTLNRRLRGRAFSLNFHTTTGVYASIVIFVVALTAVPLSLGWAKNALFAVTRSTDAGEDGPKLRASKRFAATAATAAHPKSIPMETAWEEARGLVGGPPAWASLRYPMKGKPTIEVEIVERNAAHNDVRNYVYIDPRNGKVIEFVPYGSLNLGSKLYLWVLAIHTGHFGGVFVQVLMLLGMIGAVVLGYTGVESFVRKTFRRPRPAAASSMIQARVARVRDEAEEIRSFALVSANGTPLPPATPGAHIDVRLPSGVVRQYSLTNGPDETDAYYLSVRLAPDSRGGSVAMHQLRVGDTLTISPPRNRFPVQDDARHHLLLAGGIGITPLYAMMRHIRASGGSFALHYFTRSPGATAFREALSAHDDASKVRFHYALAPERVKEAVQEVLRERPEGAHLYVCGPAPFMGLVHEAASAAWPPEAVHAEYFAADPLAEGGPRDAFEVTLARSGGTFDVPAETSILEILAGCGIDVPRSCEQGVCGTCLTGVLEGEPDHRDVFLTADERRCGDKMMVCVSRAKSRHLVLDI